MEQDQELVNAFIAETGVLNEQLAKIVTALDQKPGEQALYAQFSQIVDRIYGTAATFGYTDLADYTAMMKKVCKKCSESDNSRAQNRVIRLMETCVELIQALVKSLNDPNGSAIVKHQIKLEMAKADKIENEIFKFQK